MLELLKTIINHCNANINNFKTATKQIMDTSGGSHFVCGVKVKSGFNPIDGEPTKGMWRFISKIFEAKYTQKEFELMNGIGKR